VKTGLQLRLAQHLTLTPQLQQSIRLLQLSTLELQQEIATALAENPLLELEDAESSPELSIESLAIAEVSLERDGPMESDTFAATAGDAVADASFAESSFDASELRINGEAALSVSSETATTPSNTDDIAASLTAALEGRDDADGANESDRELLDFEEWGSANGGANDGDDSMEWQQSRHRNLRDHLLEQVPLLREGEAINALLRVLIESLDDDGFLAITLEETAALAGVSPEALEDDWQHALSLLQSLEPSGVGARNLRECLLNQLNDLRATESARLAYRIVDQYFDALSQRDYVRLRKIIGVSDIVLRESIEIIQRLNPRPGAAYADIAAMQMVPDVIVRRSKSRWSAELNPSVVPKLAVNSIYADMLQRQREGRATPLANQLQEARWLVKNVAQRFDTILRVANEIVERQQAFFDHGAVAMRPLVLREVADALGLHESTVSRVTTQKYLTSVRGTFEFKYFFGSHVATDAGGAASSTAIRAMIKTLVSEEDTNNPLSDSRIAELLGEQGIIVARRTVAKYREQQGIDPVNLRKRG
jgi:RNA polymerase sigma-54 factor